MKLERWLVYCVGGWGEGDLHDSHTDEDLPGGKVELINGVLEPVDEDVVGQGEGAGQGDGVVGADIERIPDACCRSATSGLSCISRAPNRRQSTGTHVSESMRIISPSRMSPAANVLPPYLSSMVSRA
jgi:hypothetical protein